MLRLRPHPSARADWVSFGVSSLLRAHLCSSDATQHERTATLRQWKGSSKKRKRRGTKATPLPIAKGATGRVHLVLHEDGQGRLAAASLSAPLFAEAWQNTLTASAANTALAKLGDKPLLSAVAELAHDAMSALSQFTSGLKTKPDAPQLACAEGCAHCCHQSVGVTPVEAVTIVSYLRRERTPAELEAVAVRVHTTRLRTDGLGAHERHSPDHPCPLLVEGRCSVYAVRPLSCRATNSLDAEQCRANLYDADARRRYLQTGKGPDSLLGPYRASHALSAGLQLCLSDVYGLDMRPLDLTRALDELLSKPSLAEHWLATGRGLEHAQGGDGTNNEHLLHVAGVKSASSASEGDTEANS